MIIVGAVLAGCTSADSVSPDGAPSGDVGPSAHDGATVTLEPLSLIEVPPGSFTMGSPDSEPCRDGDEASHPVTLTRPFAITRTEVTQKQFEAAMGYNPAFHSSCGERCPVEWVSWHEAAAFCNAVSAAEARPTCYQCQGSGPAVTCAALPDLLSCGGYRLPTEAEWEHAARAGTSSAFHNGGISSCMTTDGNMAKIGWYKVSSRGTTHAVAGLAPNAWGLHDTSGNVYEWTNDWYSPDLGAAAATDPTGPASGSEKVFRGGAWYFNAEHARAANRERFDPAKRFTFVGFRCVITRQGGRR